MNPNNIGDREAQRIATCPLYPPSSRRDGFLKRNQRWANLRSYASQTGISP